MTELEQAAMLLRAAGIDAAIELPNVALPETFDESLRSTLRETVSELLSEESVGPIVLKLRCEDGQFALTTVDVSSQGLVE